MKMPINIYLTYFFTKPNPYIMNRIHMIIIALRKQKTVKLLLLLLAVLGVHTSQANVVTESADHFGQAQDSATCPLYLGVHFGSTGGGIHLYAPIGQQFSARVGASFMPFNTSIKGEYSNRDTKSDAKVKAYNASLIFGWNPFYQSEGFFHSFAINLGAAYFFKLDGKLTTRLAESYSHGDIEVDPEMIGEIQTNIDYKKSISPYLGLGWSNIVLNEKFSLHADLGCYYLSKPKVSMTATGLLEGSTVNAATIENNSKNYRFLPRIEIGVSYRLK